MSGAIGPGDWPASLEISEASPWIDCDPNSGCWLWNRSHTAGGYGKAKVGGRRGASIYAHRASYTQNVGLIPEGMVVRHKCDTPACVNPVHLEIGTQGDNVLDAWSRGRLTIPPGKLSADQIEQIGLRLARGEMAKTVAEAFGVSAATISRVRPKADLIESLMAPPLEAPPAPNAPRVREDA